jgi:uncharacterized protein YcaQ
VETVSLAHLRRYVVSHQGFATRPRTSRAADVAATIRRLGCVQLDSISTVDRAHRLTLTSRLGRYPPGTVTRLLSSAQIFEYWAHEACLVPIEDFPLFKRRMEELSDRHWWGRKREDRKSEALVLEAIRERGALPSRAFEGKGPDRARCGTGSRPSARSSTCSLPARSSSRDGTASSACTTCPSA